MGKVNREIQSSHVRRFYEEGDSVVFLHFDAHHRGRWMVGEVLKVDDTIEGGI